MSGGLPNQGRLTHGRGKGLGRTWPSIRNSDGLTRFARFGLRRPESTREAEVIKPRVLKMLGRLWNVVEEHGVHLVLLPGHRARSNRCSGNTSPKAQHLGAE
jgi:hypothetical protein